MTRLILLVCTLLCALLPDFAHAQVGSFVSPGPLAAPHADLEGLMNCSQCHALGQGIAPARCMTCHEDIGTQVRTGQGFHADKGRRCESCHPDHLGRNHPLIRIQTANFDHDATGFPLRGAHSSATCEDCHAPGDDHDEADPACASCHDAPHGFERAGHFAGKSCDTCHQTLTWDALPLPVGIFDHTDPKQTDYLLTDAHTRVACRSCHPEMRFAPVPHDGCADCHADPHRTDFKAACESCHPTPDTWAVERFDHGRTRFPLVGLHASVGCESCHGDDVTKELAFRSCASCHGDPHRGQFAGQTCDTCHTVENAGFRIPDFDHDVTGFSLEGEHQYVRCETCHGEGRQATWTGIGRDCDTCHEDAHDGRYEPVPCARCHRPVGFRQPHFDHATTEFPHTGAHVSLECNSCHTDSEWTGLAFASCNHCHASSNPHADALAPETCDDCHVTSSFATMAFDHQAGTGFSLAPAHATMPCTSCHEEIERFVGPDPACTSCHTPSPTHYDGGCADCHQAPHWIPGGLGGQDHAITGFVLHGAHDRVPCASCHAPDAPMGAARSECAACHVEEDAHSHMLGNSCGDCHAPFSWYRTRFRHATTGWPLRGSHRLAECVDCHATGYVGTPTACWRCHEAEASLLIPAHQSAYLPLCDSCHRPYTWAVPSFAH